MPPTTRDSLLLSIRDAGNREAWAEFVEIYEPAVYRFLRGSGLQHADACELTQELLLKINQNIERWEIGSERGSFRGWLRRVARNLLVSWLRQEQRRSWRHASVDPAMLDASCVPREDETREFDEEAERAAYRHALLRVQNEVHASTWQAFWKVVFAGASIAEAAAELGMSQGAVRVAKCRVQARLKKVIEELCDEYEA